MKIIAILYIWMRREGTKAGTLPTDKKEGGRLGV